MGEIGQLGARRSLFTLAFAGAAALLVLPLLFARYLPMVDLPQHAAQVALWRAVAAGETADGLYELNWFTPYLLGYSLMRLLAPLAGVAAAARWVVALAALGLPLATLRLLRCAGGDRWLALAAFPLAFGFSFYWGFLNYMIALPLGVLMVAAAFRHRERLDLRSALELALLSLLLFFAHVLVLGACGLAALAVLLAGGSRRLIVRLLPLAAPAPLIAAWVGLAFGREQQVHLGTDWGQWAERLWTWPGLLLGLPRGPVALVFLAAAAALLVLLGLRAASWRRALPAFAAAAALYLVFPVFGFGVAMLYQRFAVLAAIFLLPALTLPAEGRKATAARAALVALACLWVGWAGVRHLAFDRQARAIDPLIEKMQPDQRLRMLVFDLYAPAIPRDFPVYMHHAVWYQVRRGGRVSFSFAQHYPELVRYARTPSVAVPLGYESAPERFSWAREGHLYDVFLVRARSEGWRRLFAGARGAVREVAHEGEWWLLERIRR